MRTNFITFFFTKPEIGYRFSRLRGYIVAAWRATVNASIEPGATIISESCAAYRHLDRHDSMHQIVNYTVGFV